MTVASHCHGDEGVRRSILAGVTSVEHASFMTQDTMRLMKEKQVFYVPTLTAIYSTIKGAQDGLYPETIKKKIIDNFKDMDTCLKHFKTAHDIGVDIAFGTDVGVFPYEQNVKEFDLLKQAGVDNMEILKIATWNSARVMQKNKEIGSIEQGYFADIIALDENPLINIEAVKSVSFVMQNGVVIIKKDDIS